MQFITGNDRQQTYFSTLEDQVAADNAVRIIDALSTNSIYREWVLKI